jgi:hypothetical protein
MALLIVEHMPTLRALLEVAEITQEDSCQRLWVQSEEAGAAEASWELKARLDGRRLC